MKYLILMVFATFFLGWQTPIIMTSSNAQDFEFGQVMTDSWGIDMVYVPAGTFEYGISDEYLGIQCEVMDRDNESCSNSLYEMYSPDQPQIIEIEDFWIDQYEVTVLQYTSCASLPCPESIYVEGDFGKEDHPVVGVTWYDAELFCNLRGARLPTEIEWEYAASGPQNLNYPWGNNLNNEVWTNAITYPVGTISTNISWVGAYDMSGNAWEWTSSRIDRTEISVDVYYSEAARIIRGGSIGESTILHTTFYRQMRYPFEEDRTISFRCVRTTPP